MATSTSTMLSASKSSTDPHGVLLDAGTNEVEILVFQVGEQHCGVNVAKVREVHKVEDTTFLPRYPESVDGVIRIRGEIMPAINLNKYLWGNDAKGFAGRREAPVAGIQRPNDCLSSGGCRTGASLVLERRSSDAARLGQGCACNRNRAP